MTSSGSAAGLSHSGSALAPRSKRRLEKAVRIGFLAAAAVSIFTTFGIVLALLIPSIGFFQEVSPIEFLFGDRWAPRFAEPSFGVLPLVSATIWTTVIALIFAVPLGLGAAIFLAEYASPRLRKILKPILELLAGIPTVVYGLFALFFVQTVLIKEVFKWDSGAFSVLAAGFVMGVMIIPTVASISEDAMSAVPMSMRQGSAALGANKMQTSLRVVFPAAISGIVAAIVLGVSRAVGETMIVAIAAGQQARVVAGPLEQGQTMTGFIANAALGDSRVGSIEYNTLFAVGLLLFALTLLINFIAIAFVRRIRKEY
ncbi:MAG: phosphate ABC transporter permease subunit PstC [Actinomycetota bacterium]